MPIAETRYPGSQATTFDVNGDSGIVTGGLTSGDSSWKRTYDSGHSWGVEIWAFWCGWIVLGTILPSILAFMVSLWRHVHLSLMHRCLRRIKQTRLMGHKAIPRHSRQVAAC